MTLNPALWACNQYCNPRLQLELQYSSLHLELHPVCVLEPPLLSNIVVVIGQHVGHVIWRARFDSRWLPQWLKNISSRILWQGSVNQRLGCLEVVLLPNRRGFKSQTFVYAGLRWFAKTKSIVCSLHLLLWHSIVVGSKHLISTALPSQGVAHHDISTVTGEKMMITSTNPTTGQDVTSSNKVSTTIQAVYQTG